jgi:mannose-1-phosphate guanylyltransferase
MKKIALILAGGLGAKLWPRSTEKKPKQYTHMIGEGTLLQNTYERLVNYFDKDDIFVVTGYEHRVITREQLPNLNEENIIYEPFGKNTAPAIALSAHYIRQKNYSDDTIMYVFPSDHNISNLGEFYHSLDIAGGCADFSDDIITIGIHPMRPETKFGYIQIKNGNPGVNPYYESGLKQCLTFAEKPDIGTARRFVESGDFLWNSGIFVWKISTVMAAFRKYLTEINERFIDLVPMFGKDNYVDYLQNIYRQIPSISIDYGILEKAENVRCVKASFNWSDLGNWDELYRISMKDASNNVIKGDVISLNNKNCFVMAQGKMIGIIGCDDLVVIDSDDAILICKKGESEDVQDLVDFLRRKHMNHLL